MSKRYIDVDAAVSNAEARYGEWVLAMAAAEGNRQISMVYKKQELFKAVKKVIESCPSVDLDGLRPVGHWVRCEDRYDEAWNCSVCGKTVGPVIVLCSKYCLNCGAKMEAAQTDGKT